jgi:hypothetical protein
MLGFLYGCSDADKKADQSNITEEIQKEDNFFPVTEYFLGQMAGIRADGINPIKRIGVDSSWVKVEDLEKEMSEFLHPVIDSVNMKTLFKESKFLDQTIDAYTFTYDPRSTLPDSMNLKNWTVYVDPKKFSVRRIYMVKERGDSLIQLTWQSDKWCKILVFQNNDSGNLSLLEQTEYNWSY